MYITRPLPPRRRVIILTAIELAVIIGMIAFVAWPSATTIKDLSNKIYNERVELEKLYQRGRNLKQAIQQYRQVQPEVTTLNNVYVTHGQELTFVTALETVASNTKTNQTITLNNATDTGATLPFQLTAQADLPHIISYLGGLEGLDYYVNIDTVRLSGQASTAIPFSSSTNQALTALFLATSFYKP